MMRLVSVGIVLLLGACAEELEGDPVNGEDLYQANCASCHGADGSGVDGLGSSLIGLDRQRVLDALLVPPFAMPDFSSLLTEEERADVAAYVETL